MAKQTIDQVEVSGRRVLMRVDFNVPMDGGRITDDRRIRMALPSIESVLKRGGRLILISHLGRPAGTGYEEAFTLEPCARRLTQLLGDTVRGEVKFPSHDCIDGAAVAAMNMLADGEAILLENLRFHKAEKKGDPDFAARLAEHADVYCNNAFGTCHRADASMVAVPRAMPGRPRVCGSLVEKEIRFLSDTLADPDRPFVVVLGGAKVSDKLPAIEFLLQRADAILIGGAMAYTFLKAMGTKVGSSRVEEDRLEDAKRIVAAAKDKGCELLLPTDHVCSTTFDEKTGDNKTFDGDIGDGYMGLDIGPATRDRYSDVLRKAGTIVWNGPMGVFEWSLFAVGTKQVAKAIVEATAQGAVSIVGGGDSAAAAEQFGVADQLTHVSTGGGASLEMLSGHRFESVDVLDDA
ncbi:MAG: phosphoglycerate kinase [Phycisphaerales bacterium]|nr:phosphoglycerate kinase [Phycisphaerales bacterium]